MQQNPSQPETRASLLLRIRDPEDLVAWQEFVEIYQPIIFFLAKKRGLQKADCDDITQEVLTRVAKYIQKFDPKSPNTSFRGWLATITKNQTIDLFRQKQKLNQRSLDSSLGNQISVVDESDYDAEHQKQLFQWAAKRIKKNFQENTWLAFWKTTIEGEPPASVGKELKMSVGQVYVNKSRVMALLKKTIQQTQFDSGMNWG